MKRLSVVAVLLTLARVPVPVAAQQVSAAGAAALSGVLQTAVGRGDVPGVVALVVNREGVVYEGAFGKLNVAANIDMPVDAIFRIASMTKPVTSVAIMMLVEEGKLRLDDPVSKYLPAFARAQVVTHFNEAEATYESRPVARAITIRHLLAHTSGIGYAFSDPWLRALQTRKGVSDADFPLLHEPGAKWTYGASTRVLGDLVEQISGQRVDAFLEARILGPLGMRDTAYRVLPAAHSRVVTVHQRTDGRFVEQPNSPAQESIVRGDGGLYSTAGDYGLFLRMFLNQGQYGRGRLLLAASVRAMTENQIGDVVVGEQPAADAARTRPFPLGAGFDKFGLGFQIATAGGTAPGMRSAGSYSWAGINNTHFWVDPNRQIGVVVLMQVLPFYDEAAIGVLRRFEEQLYRHLR